MSDWPSIDMWVRPILKTPSLIAVLTAMIFGLGIHRIGNRPFLVASIVIFVVSGMSGYLAEGIGQIIAWPALIGLSKAALLTVCANLAARHFARGRTRNFVSLQSATIKIGGVALIFSAGFTADTDWRLPFLLYFLALFLLPGVFKDISEVRQVTTIDAPEPGNRAGGDALWVAAFLTLVVFASQAVFYQIPLEHSFSIFRTFEGGGEEIDIALFFAALLAGGLGLAYGNIRAPLTLLQIFAAVFICLGIGTVLVMPNAAVGMADVAPRLTLGFGTDAITAGTFLCQFGSSFLFSQIGDAFSPRTSFQLIGGANAIFVLIFVVHIPIRAGGLKPSALSLNSTCFA